MEKTQATKQDNGTPEKKTRKPRTLAEPGLLSQIEKLSLESKIKFQTAIKASIEEDRKNLEAQLSLITENGK